MKEEQVKKDGSKAVFDLQGIDSISAYAEKDPSALIDWTRYYGFPMEKVGGKSWGANSSEIRRWYEKRGCTPKTVSEGLLNSFAIRELRLTGKGRKFNKTLNGINSISSFVGLSIGAVFDWYSNFPGCPIQKASDKTLVVDADELITWADSVGIGLKIRE